MSTIEGIDMKGTDRFVGYSLCPQTGTWFLHGGPKVVPVNYVTHVKDKPMVGFLYERTSRF